jgi:hypothetical protein
LARQQRGTSGDRRATIRRPARSVTNRRNSLRHRAGGAHRRPRWLPRPKRRVAPALRLLMVNSNHLTPWKRDETQAEIILAAGHEISRWQVFDGRHP